MDASTYFVLTAGLIVALGAAALRYGTSDALEGLWLIVLLIALRAARAAIKIIRAVLVRRGT